MDEKHNKYYNRIKEYIFKFDNSKYIAFNIIKNIFKYNNICNYDQFDKIDFEDFLRHMNCMNFKLGDNTNFNYPSFFYYEKIDDYHLDKIPYLSWLYGEDYMKIKQNISLSEKLDKINKKIDNLEKYMVALFDKINILAEGKTIDLSKDD